MQFKHRHGFTKSISKIKKKKKKKKEKKKDKIQKIQNCFQLENEIFMDY